MTLKIEARPHAVRFQVKVQPRASRNEIAGVQQGALRLRVSAPPRAGEANRTLVTLLAEYLKVPRAWIRIVAGQRARGKVIEVAGLDPATVRTRLRVHSE